MAMMDCRVGLPDVLWFASGAGARAARASEAELRAGWRARQTFRCGGAPRARGATAPSPQGPASVAHPKSVACRDLRLLTNWYVNIYYFKNNYDTMR